MYIWKDKTDGHIQTDKYLDSVMQVNVLNQTPGHVECWVEEASL